LQRKKINLHRQIRYISKRGYFFSTLKTESSYRSIIVGDDLLAEMSRWQNQQAENEKQFGGSYVYVYRENNGHIERRSKTLPVPPNAEKVSLLCIRDDGLIILRGVLTDLLRAKDLNDVKNIFNPCHAAGFFFVAKNLSL